MSDPADFLAVDDLLGDDERDIRDTVRSFAESELLPHVAEWYDEGTLPDDLGPKLGKLGLLGMHLEGYGCAGTSATAYGVACRELEAVDSGLRSFVSVQGSLAMFAIHRWGSDEQKDEWLPRMASGRGARLLRADRARRRQRPGLDAHPGPPRRGRLGAERVEDVDHQRHARRCRRGLGGDDRRRHPRVRGAHRHPGLLGARRSSASCRCGPRSPPRCRSTTCGCRPDAVFPDVRGLKGPLSCLNEARYGILWGAVGAARACFEEALAYSLEREQFGKPLASFQLTQKKLADMVIALNNASLAAVQIGRLKDAGTLTPAQVSYGKLGNVRAAVEVARTARTMLGGAGITLDHSVMRHMNNLETVMTYEGTEEMHTLSLGAELTGIRAFR